MGARVSNLFGKSSDKDEQEENLRRYQEELDAGGTAIGVEKRELRWWERLLFDKYFRIAYIVILAIILGLLIPIIIFANKLETRNKAIYGSCLIKDHARFECLTNSVNPVTEKECSKALCCWQNDDSLPFKCYHSFPSAYQYNVSGEPGVHNENGIKTTFKKSTRNVELGTWVEMDAKASHQDMMSPLRILTHWQNEEHLTIEIFNANAFPDRHNPTKVKMSKGDEKRQEGSKLPFSVSWGENEKLFFLRIGRTDTDETIFDTRLGPIYSSSNDITIATLLPTKYFYGLKGGQGSASSAPITYPILNGFENAEFPFYVSFESSGQWHGVLIDTTQPILVQVVQAPGLMFQMESSEPEMNLHFFAGPTQAQVLRQLHSYIRAKNQIDPEQLPYIPSYWGLGMHLCRSLSNGTAAFGDISELLQISFVFDSDCIDDYLRHPQFINYTLFPTNTLGDTLGSLANQRKRILLSQRSTIPVSIKGSDRKLPKVLDVRNPTHVTPFQGQVGDLSVNYVDYFDPQLDKYPMLPISYDKNKEIRYDGFIVHDNFPIVDNASELCPSPETRLQAYFTTNFQTTSDNLLTHHLWGSLCPLTALHKLNKDGSENKTHLSLHNIYGEKGLKLVKKTLQETNKADLLLGSSSYWTESSYYGAFHGLIAPFTWKGLQESVENTVRNYALAPVSGTHICGAPLGNRNISFDQNNELCIRWFQFGLLLPFARNTYDGRSSFGPVHLPGAFKDYLSENIRTRYTFAPYYYTQLKNFQQTYVPMIRPMAFDFHAPHERNETLPRVNQFMVGDAMFAAPMIDRGDTRSCYFPAGVWYSMDGGTAYESEDAGDVRQISGHISETPLFIRGGHIIPTLQNPFGQSIQESLQGKYTLITALSNKLISPRTANGSLIVETNMEERHLVDFGTTVTEISTDLLQIVVTVNSTCPTNFTPKISTTIDQVRLFGLDFLGALDIQVTGSKNHADATIKYFGEHNSLRIYGLDMNWCHENKNSKYEVTITQKEVTTTATTITSTDSTTTEETSDSTITTDITDSTITTDGSA